jgi:hypothetical protein
VAKAISKQGRFMLTSRAIVAIERPARYGKQLAGHIAHKVQVDEVGDGWELHIGEGLGRVMPHADSLELVAEAESPEMLERIKDVLGRHLLQFTTKLPGVTITWTDSSVAS